MEVSGRDVRMPRGAPTRGSEPAGQTRPKLRQTVGLARSLLPSLQPARHARAAETSCARRDKIARVSSSMLATVDALIALVNHEARGDLAPTYGEGRLP